MTKDFFERNCHTSQIGINSLHMLNLAHRIIKAASGGFALLNPPYHFFRHFKA